MRTVKASAQGLKIVDKARIKKGWNKYEKTWWQLAASSESTLKRFWRQEYKIDVEAFQKICEVVGIDDWENIVDWEENISEPSHNCYYIKRSFNGVNESSKYQVILEPGALIRIIAPRKMGKSSFLNKIINYADRAGYRTVRLNFLQIENTKFNNLNDFLRCFCINISKKLQFPCLLDDYWSKDAGNIISCTNYVEMLLRQSNNPLVLGLDGVDRIFKYPEISEDFFYMLRSWYEEVNNIEIWEQLRQVIVHCTEDYGSLNINKSPFNVGEVIELKEFNHEQVIELAKSYKLNLKEKEIHQLMGIIGGHPYLVNLAFDYFSKNDISLENFLQNAPTDTGVYYRYLQPLLVTLKEHPELAEALRKVINIAENTQLDSIMKYKLYNMGLIKYQDNYVIPRCKLYQLYFQKYL